MVQQPRCSGKNWLGLQLMLLRDKLSREFRWTSWIRWTESDRFNLGKLDPVLLLKQALCMIRIEVLLDLLGAW